MNLNPNSSREQLVITFLGQEDKLEEVRYCLDNGQDIQSVKSNRLAIALSKWYPNAQVVALVTKETETQIGQLEERVGRDVVQVSIPNATNEKDYWRIYSQLSKVILGKAGDGKTIEVIFDITNGFRSLPFIGLLALEFLQSASEISIKHVFYGAKEDGSDDCVPVYDLEPFQSMLDWANATDRFLATGDAQKLAVAMREHTVPLLGEGASTLNQLADTVAQVSNALLMNNPFEAGPLAKKALELLNSLDIGDEHPISLLLDRLKNQMKPMAFDADTDTDKEIVQALFFIISWYITHNHHERAAALAKEWVFLFAKLNAAKSIRDKNFKKSNMSFRLQCYFELLKAIRNDLAHMNMDVIMHDKKAIKSSVARKKLSAIFEKLVELARTEGLSIPQTYPSANL